MPRAITNQKGFRTPRNIIQRGVYVTGTNKKLKFVSYCRHQLTQYGLRHRPVRVSSNMEHGKEGVVLCKKKLLLHVFIDQKIMSLNLQNYKINRPFPRSASFTVTGNERRRKKTACKSRNNAQFS